MNIEKLTEVLKDDKLSVDHPLFYEKAFSLACHQRKISFSKEGDNFKRVCAEEYDQLSRQLDRSQLQESCAVRNVLRTRRLANLLINDKGELLVSVLPRLISHLKRHLHSLGPNRQYDTKRQEHLLNVITLLSENKELVRLLKSIDKPISHKYAEQIIRDTLLLPANVSLTDAHARRAVLSAWMCMLRQNVGSCFATAPAIIIQEKQPERFLKDISELLSTGRLKRTFGGVEYSVPLSSSWGAGDLKKPFFLFFGEKFEKSDLWYSPGIAAAFHAADIINPDTSSEETIKKIKETLLELTSSFEKNPYVITTAEDIIRRALLKQLGITEKDIHEFENRPQGLIHNSLLMQVSRVGSGGKNELCSSFFVRFAAACSAFKGLSDNALLKAWEFSLASFAETKAQFTRWNLYSSLGLGPQENGGIGARLYEVIKDKLDHANQRVHDLQYEYENLFHQLKTLESRIHSASEREAQWIRIEYQTKRNEFYTFEEMRNEANHKAHKLADLYNFLVEQYDALFPRYFQEVYDADMHDVSTGPYDDSPAGFRLLYKHGISNTSQWSPIKTPTQFTEALASFFNVTETYIANLQEMEGLQGELSEIVTAIVSHVRTKEFLETAFHRMAAAHQKPAVKDPLNHLDLIEKKPWAYTSGGTMSTLVSCYYRLENKPTEVSRWVESPTELCVFLIDTLKQIPPKIAEDYLRDSSRSFLIHSPTHAFLLKPGLSPFKEAWQSDSFTYTWLRDNIIAPRRAFVEGLWLNEEKISYLIDHLAKFVAEDQRHYFLRSFHSIYGSMRPYELREHILEVMRRERGLRQAGLRAEEIDSSLYSLLPLFHRSELRDCLEKIYAEIFSNSETITSLLELFDTFSFSNYQQPIVDASTLQGICKGLLCLALEETSSERDYHVLTINAARKLGYALPVPLIFADTNWVKEEFGFVLNPGTAQFELWRVDSTGQIGAPMSSWSHWLDGSQRHPDWGVYTKPYEYQSA